MSLDAAECDALANWRQRLHQMPEVSGAEQRTAADVQSFLTATEPDMVVTGLGGHGVAVIYEGAAPGPTVMFRAELDALPIQEIGSIPHRSRIEGRGHLCGHDGHMAILAGLGLAFGKKRPEQGRAILLFQPAEETGAGAASVIADPQFAALRPDFVFSLHNLPGLPLGAVALREGVVNCASRGLRVRLQGRTAHASMPETGRSPMRAISELMPALGALGSGQTRPEPGFAMATVTHAQMGEPAFGIAPADAEIWVTLRSFTDDRMAELVFRAKTLVEAAATRDELECELSWHDVFHHCENQPEAVACLRRALDGEGIAHTLGEPMRASEDFGRFGAVAKSAMFFLGAGETHPSLHNPDYDFPDALIAVGARIFHRTARDLLG